MANQFPYEIASLTPNNKQISHYCAQNHRLQKIKGQASSLYLRINMLIFKNNNQRNFFLPNHGHGRVHCFIPNDLGYHGYGQ